MERGITSHLRTMQFCMTGRTTSTPGLAWETSAVPLTLFTKFTLLATIISATLPDYPPCTTVCIPRNADPLPSLVIGRVQNSVIRQHIVSLSIHDMHLTTLAQKSLWLPTAPINAVIRLPRHPHPVSFSILLHVSVAI